MAIKTVTSEDARIKMRDILDEVNTGDEVVIERYRRPTAVVVGYAQWQAWKAAQEAELTAHAHQVLSDILSGKVGTVSHAELVRKMAEKHGLRTPGYVGD
jgi:prevent-host-death family protein